MMACVTGWFETHRSLAVSLVSAGMGMAPMTMSPLAAWLVSHHDWRTTLQILGLVAAALMIPAALLVRRPPALAAGGARPTDDPQASMTVQQALRSPQFAVLVLTNFFCCATHSGPIFQTVSYAQTCGIPLVAAVSIYSVEGLAGMGGRDWLRAHGRPVRRPGLAHGLLSRSSGNIKNHRVFPRGIKVRRLHHPHIHIHAQVCFQGKELDRIELLVEQERYRVVRRVAAQAFLLPSLRSSSCRGGAAWFDQVSTKTLPEGENSRSCVPFSLVIRVKDDRPNSRDTVGVPGGRFGCGKVDNAAVFIGPNQRSNSPVTLSQLNELAAG